MEAWQSLLILPDTNNYFVSFRNIHSYLHPISASFIEIESSHLNVLVFSIPMDTILHGPLRKDRINQSVFRHGISLLGRKLFVGMCSGNSNKDLGTSTVNGTPGLNVPAFISETS